MGLRRRPPRAPEYGRGGPLDLSQSSAEDKLNAVQEINNRRMSAARVQPFAPYAHAAWSTMLKQAEHLAFFDPAALQASWKGLLGELAKTLDELDQAGPTPKQARSTELEIRGRKTAQLCLEISLIRKAWADVPPSLNYYATFTRRAKNATYECNPLQPQTLCDWLRAAPLGETRHVNLWQPGLAHAVDPEVMAVLGSRFHSGELPLRRMEQHLYDAAKWGRSFDRALYHTAAYRALEEEGLAQDKAEARFGQSLQLAVSNDEALRSPV